MKYNPRSDIAGHLSKHGLDHEHELDAAEHARLVQQFRKSPSHAHESPQELHDRAAYFMIWDKHSKSSPTLHSRVVELEKVPDMNAQVQSLNKTRKTTRKILFGVLVWLLLIVAVLFVLAVRAHAQTTVTVQGVAKGTTANNKATVDTCGADANHNCLSVGVPQGVTITSLPTNSSVNLSQYGGVTVGAANALHIQPGTSAVFHTICDSGCGGAASFADSSAFTFATTAVNNMSAVVDDVSTNTVAENSAGALRMTTNRILYVDLSKTGANTNKLLVTVDPITFASAQAVTQSGTWTVNIGAGSAVIGHVIADSGSTTAVTGNVTVVQPTGTNLHAVLDTTSTTAVTQATGTNLHAVLDSGTTTVTQGTGSNLHAVTDSGSTTAATQATAANLNATVVQASGANLHVNCDSGCGGAAADTTASGSLGALNAAVQVALAGLSSASVTLPSGNNLIGTIIGESSSDGGTTWQATVIRPATPSGIWAASVAVSSTNLAYNIQVPGGASHVRAKVSAYTSGSATAGLRAVTQQDALPDPLVQGTQANGSATIPNPVVMGGSDGTNVRALKTDSSGVLQMNLTGLAVACSGLPALVGDVTSSSGSCTTAIAPGVIVAADISNPITNSLSPSTTAGLPAATSFEMFFSGGTCCPVLGTWYVGDGAGREVDISYRTGSVDTVLGRILDFQKQFFWLGDFTPSTLDHETFKCDTFAGAPDWAVQINSCIVAAGVTNGGIADATGFSANQVAISTATTIALNRNNVLLMLPVGIMASSASPVVSVTAINDRIVGAGVEATRLSSSNTTGDIVQIAGSQAATFFQMSLLSLASSGNKTAGSCINNLGSADMTIEHMQVFPCAIGFKAAVVGASGTVSDVVFGGTDSTTTWVTGVQVGGAAAGLVSSIRFNNVIVSAETPFSDSGWVIESGSDGFNCVQCGAQRNGNDIKGMHIRNTAGGSAPSNIMISNTGMECGPTKDCLTIDAVGLNVTMDSSIISAGLRNVVFNGGKSFHIANSTIVLAQQEGVILTAQPTGEFVISTSTISDSSNATNNTSANFKANANVGNFKLTGNTFKQTLAAPPANLPIDDILITAGTGDNITIDGNNLNNHVTASLVNSATGGGIVIFNNLPRSVNQANPLLLKTSADFVTAANTNLQTVPGLTWVMPANTVMTQAFSCELLYSQQTAAVAADAFGVQAASLAPTQINAQGHVELTVGPPSTYVDGNLTALTTTTATNIIAFTASAITTIFNAHISGQIENPSGVANTINIMAKTGTAADTLTVKRGSFCVVN